MATMFARHTVSDYENWRKGYDAAAPMQKAGGVTAHAVYRSADDPNEVTVMHDFATIEAAKAFIEKPEMQQAMQAAGVVGAPTVWFTDKV